VCGINSNIEPNTFDSKPMKFSSAAIKRVCTDAGVHWTDSNILPVRWYG
jgi:hypothetical protein